MPAVRTKTKLARTKTFTGCWTCRGRKIKCDLKRPHCDKCKKAKIQCEGYAIKLRWEGSRNLRDGSSVEEDGALQRRQVDFVVYPPHMKYETYEDLDDLLAELNSPAFQSQETISKGPFSVFEGTPGTFGRKKKKKPKKDNTVLEGMDPPSPSLTELELSIFADRMNQTTDTSNDNTATSATEMVMDPRLTAFSEHGSVAPSSIDSPTTSNLSSSRLPYLLNDKDHLYEGPTDVFEAATASVSKIPLNIPIPTRYILTADSQFLLKHYTDHISPIMSVICSDKNPWNTIYLPRAYAAVGDIIVLGKTSLPRSALLHSLLAIAAFHLSSKLEGSDKAYFFGRGIELKARAVANIQLCMSLPEERFKYKDLLASILSMVTINVIEGTTPECRGHLAACENMINHRNNSRPIISKKAQLLHRIAGFLTILQDSTTINVKSLEALDSNVDLERWIDLKKEDYDDVSAPTENLMDKDIPSPSAFFNDVIQFQDYWNEQSTKVGFNSLPAEFYNKELVTMLSLYGIPDSLILIFSQVVSVSRKALFYRLNGMNFPYSFVQSCFEVESSLIRWKNGYHFNEVNSPFTGDRHEVMCHHMLAFHRALVIYYARLSRNVDPSTIQEEVEDVLNALENVQALNAKHTEPLAVPLMFPAFIAGCDAVNRPGRNNGLPLRTRFDIWLNQMCVEGLGTYSLANEIIREVWRRRDAGNIDADWWGVIMDRGADLMLG